MYLMPCLHTPHKVHISVQTASFVSHDLELVFALLANAQCAEHVEVPNTNLVQLDHKLKACHFCLKLQCAVKMSDVKNS